MYFNNHKLSLLQACHTLYSLNDVYPTVGLFGKGDGLTCNFITCINLRSKVDMLMHFNDARMWIEVGVPFHFRDWNSNQNLFEEIISCINANYL